MSDGTGLSLTAPGCGPDHPFFTLGCGTGFFVPTLYLATATMSLALALALLPSSDTPSMLPAAIH